jgi:hypothetical protein
MTTVHYPDPRVAVLIRCFKIDEKALDLYTQLRGNNREYDVFLLVDETRGRAVSRMNDVIRFSLDTCPRVGLRYTRQDLFWLSGDIPMFFAKDTLQDHSHFIQIDYDVQFTKDGIGFLNRIAAALTRADGYGLDAVVLQHTILHPPCAWPFFAAAARQFKVVRFSYGPFVALSRRALGFLHAQRRLELATLTESEDIVISEAFIPSHLVEAGFHCMDLEELAPGSYESWDATTSMRMGPLGLALGAPIDVKPAIEMVHPVYSVEDHFIRAIQHAREHGTLATLREKLPGEAYAFLEPAVRAHWLERIDAELAAV